MNYDSLRQFYADNFSLGCINSDINTKFALISLICLLTYKLQQKKPDVTCYQVIMKIDNELPEKFIKGLSIVCEDFMYGCKEFPDFGVELKKIPGKIKEILHDYLPF